MTFSKQRLYSLRPQKSRAASTFFFALIAATLIFLPYMLKDSGYFLFYGDFNVQQIPFYQRCHELVRSGNIGWDFGTDLGANFVGSYTFYLLGSPFFWLTIPFPNSFVPYLMGPLLILKFALAAWAAYLYLARFLKNRETARLGGLLYAFSGFSIYNIFFNHFHEALIVFPLLLLSLELLITENRRGVFALMVCVCAVTNYFFFFGMVVFAVIYWFVRVGIGAIKMTVGRFFTLAFEAVLGFIMSAFILLPTIMALAGNTRLDDVMTGWGALLYGKEQIYANVLQCFLFPPDLPARPIFFPGADVKWSSLGGWLPIFSMVGVFAFMGNRKGHWLKRVIGIMIFMSLVPILNSAFYMFNSAYYARWYYMPILLMCLATGVAIEDREIDWSSSFRWVAGITVAVSLIIGFMPAKLDENGKITEWGIYVKDTQNVFRDRFILSCALAIIGLLVLKVLLSVKKKNLAQFYKLATACVLIMSVIYSSVFVYGGKTHSYDEKTVMIPLIEEEITLDPDRGDYRIDVWDGVDNTAMYFGYNSINAFHSIVPTSVTEFYSFIGEERGVASRPTEVSYAIRPLLSVKYLFNMTDSKSFQGDIKNDMPGYELIETQNGYDIYENKNYIPYGFTYDYYMTREEALWFGADNAANMMLKGLLLEYDQIEKYKDILPSIKEVYTFDYSDKSKKGFYFDDQTFSDDCAALRENAAYEFTQGESSFSAKINLDSANLVFFSIPYEDGWTAYVNGEEAEIEKVNIGFMAVLCPAGECEIEFRYKTPGLALGIMITGGCIIVFILYLIFAGIYKSRRAANCCYPEGDELIARWSEDEAREAALMVEDGDIDEWFDSPQESFEGGFSISISPIEEKSIDKTDSDE